MLQNNLFNYARSSVKSFRLKFFTESLYICLKKDVAFVFFVCYVFQQLTKSSFLRKYLTGKTKANIFGEIIPCRKSNANKSDLAFGLNFDNSQIFAEGFRESNDCLRGINHLVIRKSFRETVC